jgi:hypothetical protein
MPRSRLLMRVLFFVVAYGELTFSSASAFPQLTSSVQSSNLFEDYFKVLAVEQDFGSDRSWDAYEKIAKSIGTMTPVEITKGISVIDQQIDNTSEGQRPWTKAQAVYLLGIIGRRPDGPELLALQMDRLAAMLNNPSHLLSAQAVMVLQAIGYRRPDVVWPILEAALEAPEVNNTTGIGPGIAVILLRMGPHGDDVTKHVAQYMRRPDLTEQQLLSTIIGIDSSSFIGDILATELVRSLDFPSEHVKNRALVGLSRSSPSAMDVARARVQKMANDPRETAHIRRLAAAALEGEITEAPDTDK